MVHAKRYQAPLGAFIVLLSVLLSGCNENHNKNSNGPFVINVTGPSPTTFQCNDGQNNDPDEDNLIDANDPGCHWDNNAGNPNSYDPTDNTERNGSGPSGTAPPPPTGSFVISGPISCSLVRGMGEYTITFSWNGPAATRVEYKSLRDGIWKDALSLFEASVSGNTFTAYRLRTDQSHSFRVWSGSTLWSTTEAEAACRQIPACRNTTDDDQDGLIDYPNDPGCTNLEDDDEWHFVPPPPPPPTSTTPSTPPGTVTPPSTTPPTPPSGGSCAGASASLPDAPPRGSSRGFVISAPAGCQSQLDSNNHHVVSVNPATGTGTYNGSITALNSGTATIRFIAGGVVLSSRTYVIP